MSGKKKLFRQGVDLANSRRMRVRRRARPRIVRHATRQIIIVVTIAVAFWATMDFFVETWLPHNSERTTSGEKSSTQTSCELIGCVHQAAHDGCSQKQAQRKLC